MTDIHVQDGLIFPGQTPVNGISFHATTVPPSSSGCLYIVSTPIGNPEDISLRAIRVLGRVAIIAAENAGVTGKLLAHHGITTAVVSYRPRAHSDVTSRLLSELAAGNDIAFVTDAGTPVIADPGQSLIRSAIAQGARVIPVPGASALLSALVASGLVPGRFAFDGFPPRCRADRQEFFAQLTSETRPVLLYESRRYLRSTLQALLAALGPCRRMTLARDLTRDTEAVLHGTIQ